MNGIVKSINWPILTAIILVSIFEFTLLALLFPETVIGGIVVFESLLVVFFVLFLFGLLTFIVTHLITRSSLADQMIFEKVDGAVRDNIDEQLVNSFIKKVFSSKKFPSYFSELIDEDFKNNNRFNYVPRLLKEVSEKKQRFQILSNRFLISVAVFSFLYVFFLMAFGYVLVNQDSVGIVSSVSSLQSDLDDFKELNQSSIEILQAKRVEILRSLEPYSQKSARMNFYVDYVFTDTTKYTSIAVFNFHIENAIDSLDANNFSSAHNSLILAYRSYPQYRINQNANSVQKEEGARFKSTTLAKSQKTLGEIRDELGKLERRYKYFDKRLAEVVAAVSVASDHISEIDIPETYNIGEILKRFFIGLVISSALFAILRFFISQYKSAYGEVLKSENENISIRKYVVAYSSTDNEMLKKIALKHLLEVSLDASSEPSIMEEHQASIKSSMDEILEYINRRNKNN